VIAPLYWFSEEEAEPAHATPGYGWGVGFGTAWTMLWMTLGGVLALVVVAESKGDIECLGGCLGLIGLFLGCLGGILVGVTIYWLIYGAVALVIYLNGSLGDWLQWLFGTH
jgi:hypothetical protein